MALIISNPKRALWYRYFPDVPLTEPRWLERHNYAMLKEALAITAEKDNAGRFEIRNQENIGAYVSGVIRRLKTGEKLSYIKGRLEITLPLVVKGGYKITERDRARFDEKLVSSGDCLRFTGAKTEGGYGRFYVNRKRLGAHVFGFLMEIGYLPAEDSIDWKRFNIAHSCRFRDCCNPRHLALKSKQLNLDERIYGKSKSDAGQIAENIALPSTIPSTMLINKAMGARHGPFTRAKGT